MNFRPFRFCALLGFLVVGLGLRAQTTSNSSDNSDAAVATPPPPTVPTDAEHPLHPEDVIRVQVLNEDDINQQCEMLPVSQDSTITLPLIGTISVKGKTVRQTQQLITFLYNRDYLVNPQVSVLMLKYADRSVNVVGSVTKQGRIPFPDLGGLSIIDALALAGGQTRLADLKRVKVTHIDAQGRTKVQVVDVDALMKQSGAKPVMLKPGDVVFVPERIL